MADTPKHSVSVAGIVVDDQDRVLVIQRRDNGRWEPPGGVLELDETPERGVEREIFEETGVRAEVGQLTGVYKNMKLGVVSLVFRCRPLAGASSQTTEARTVAWMSIEQVRDAMTEAYLVRVEDAFYNEIAVRVHDGSVVLAKS